MVLPIPQGVPKSFYSPSAGPVPRGGDSRAAFGRIHGSRASRRPSQDGISGWIAMPRKVRAASLRIAPPITTVEETMTIRRPRRGPSSAPGRGCHVPVAATRPERAIYLEIGRREATNTRDTIEGLVCRYQNGEAGLAHVHRHE